MIVNNLLSLSSVIYLIVDKLLPLSHLIVNKLRARSLSLSLPQRSILEQMARIEAAIPCVIDVVVHPPPVVLAAEAGLAAVSMSSAELSILRSSEAVAEGGGGGACTEHASENCISPPPGRPPLWQSPGGLRMSRVGKSFCTPDTCVALAMCQKRPSMYNNTSSRCGRE